MTERMYCQVCEEWKDLDDNDEIGCDYPECPLIDYVREGSGIVKELNFSEG